jgi:FAD/FMN-containing dehydrogenase
VTSTLDRRSLLLRGAGAAAAVTLPAWRLVAEAQGAVDPRLRELVRAVRGPVIAPSSDAYQVARLAYNERFDAIRPLAILRPRSVEDVRQAILWARRFRVPLAVRSGGHSYGGYSTTNGLVVDLRALSSIAFGPTGLATIGAGARLIDVEAALARRGRAIPSGSCATVGIGGLALGGGVGFSSRKFGTTSDNIVAVEIVTADGRARICNARENVDLLWACRGGGGGNFGVVTRFTFRTHPVGPVTCFVLDWPWEQARDALSAWQRLAPHSPDELFSVFALRTGQEAPSVQASGQFFGTEVQLRALLEPLVGVAGGRLTVAGQSYLDAQLRWAECAGKTLAACRLAIDTPGGTLQRAAFAGKSDYFATDLPAAAVEVVVQWLGRAQATQFGKASLLLDSYGGAINRVPPGQTAFVHRDALFSAQYLARWYRAQDAPAAISWIRGLYAAMRPYVSGFAYQNYIDPDLRGWKHAYYGSNYPRLQQIKSRVDPDWLFRFAQGIPP